MGLSSTSQPLLVTPVVPVPGPPCALPIPATAVLSASSQLVDSSSCSAERHHSWQSPGPRPVLASSAIPDPVPRSSQTRSWRQPSTDPGLFKQPFSVPFLDPSPVCTPRTRQPAVPGPIIRPEAVTTPGTHQPAIPGPVTSLEAIPVPGTSRPAVPGPVTYLAAVSFNRTCLPPGRGPGPDPVACLGAAPLPGILPPPAPSCEHWLLPLA